MQSLERDQLIKIRKAMELLQARPREHLFLAFELFTIYGVLGLKKSSTPEEKHVEVRNARAKRRVCLNKIQ